MRITETKSRVPEMGRQHSTVSECARETKEGEPYKFKGRVARLPTCSSNRGQSKVIIIHTFNQVS